MLADAKDTAIVGNNGMGGQGVLPLPVADHGWIEQTAKLSGSGQLSAEVEAWLGALTTAQRGIELSGKMVQSEGKH
jgi:hypothetical protein